MPLSDQASYADTGAELLAHWAALDAAIGGDGLVLPGNVDRAQAVTLYNNLMDQHRVLVELENDEEIAERRVLLGRQESVGRMREFNETLRMYWGGEAVAEVLPEMPVATAALDHVLRAMRRVLRLWLTVNAAPAPSGLALPLVLPRGGGCARADFLLLYNELLAAQGAEEDAVTDQDAGRAERAALERRVRRVLGQYRALVPVRMGRESDFATTLPRLTPLPGHTPDRPAVQAAVEAEVFRLTWDALEEPTLKCWQVRTCRAPRYDKTRERVLATLPPDAPRLWEMRRDLAAGASFRVYAVLTTGNERGSKSLRPPAP